MIALNYNKLVTVLDVTLFRVLMVSEIRVDQVLTPVGQLTSAPYSQLCFDLMIGSDNAALFLSICGMHNAGHCAGAAHCSYNRLNGEKS